MPVPPRLMDLQQFLIEARQGDASVFLALHGGIGEDGTLQSLLGGLALNYTGGHRLAQ